MRVPGTAGGSSSSLLSPPGSYEHLALRIKMVVVMAKMAAAPEVDPAFQGRLRRGHGNVWPYGL